MKKILIVSPYLANGGSERVLSILANKLSENGFEIFMLLLKENRVDYYLNDKIRIIYLKSNGIRQQLNNIIFTIKNIKPNYTLSFFDRYSIVLSFLQKKFNYKAILSLRNDPKQHFTGIKEYIIYFLRKIAYEKAYHIVFQTYDAEKSFSKKIINKSKVILNPVSVCNMPFWNENESYEVVTFCRLHEQKNLPLLMQSIINLKKEFPNLLLRIYGEGESREKLQKLIDLSNANKYIFLEGRTNDVYNIMKNSHCFVLSSNYEGMSNSMLEALCIGVPTICTDCPIGGARTVIENNINGILVPVNDIKSMENAIRLVLSNKKIAIKLSNNAIKLRMLVDSNIVCNQWISLFD